MSVRIPLLLLIGLAGSCVSLSESGPSYESGLDGLEVHSLQPTTWLPGTTLVAQGQSFVDGSLGEAQLRVTGTLRLPSGEERDVDLALPTTTESSRSVVAVLDPERFAVLGGPGELVAEIRLEVRSLVDSAVYTSPPLPITTTVRDQLTPSLVSIDSSRLVFVNDRISIAGDGLLLGGEGITLAVIEGCFAVPALECTPIEPATVPVTPDGPFTRNRGSFPFAPRIVGIEAGEFVGTVHLQNDHKAGGQLTSAASAVDYELTESMVLNVSPGAASLGQYIEIQGGGFVGPDDDGYTLIRFRGEFFPASRGRPVAVDTLVVPEYMTGNLVRYALNEDDSLGDLFDMRGDLGTITGDVSPVVTWNGVEVMGEPTPVTFDIAPVKQVVYLNFTPDYLSSLRHFGLRATDSYIRDRVLAVTRRDYAGVNVDFRTTAPDDFAVYAEVQISGVDPNGLGLLGYDNTPGKDVGNQRLGDHIGGVNATTQRDGYPGYGGVFISSLFVFSEHPGKLAARSAMAMLAFDLIFDPFRPDLGAAKVTASDFAGGVDTLPTGDGCPATDRRSQIGCAIFVLGNLIGTTLSHEIGHSLGLAQPDRADGVHYSTDESNRLMDAGSFRPFLERAELEGQGPAMFCDGAYDYLRVILPTSVATLAPGSVPPTNRDRPSCL